MRAIIDGIRKLVRTPATADAIDLPTVPHSRRAKLADDRIADLQVNGLPSAQDLYDRWASGAIRGAPRAPSHLLTTTWAPDSKYWPIVVKALDEAEVLFVRDLLGEIRDNRIDGAIVEFGVFEGRWLATLADLQDELNLGRQIYGFDSFEGLPSVSTSDDLDCWSEGQYRADFDSVRKRLRCDERDNIHLVKGWFSDTLTRSDIRAIRSIAYARVDCDLYQPAVEVLDYLKSRLTSGAILVFDDWTWRLDKGETKAFSEWSKLCGFNFEFLGSSMGHLYLKVLK